MSDPNNLPADAPTEPLISVATVTAVVTVLIGVSVSFGMHITEDQKTAILGVVAVLAPLLVGVIGRTKVYSPATVRKLLLARRPR